METTRAIRAKGIYVALLAVVVAHHGWLTSVSMGDMCDDAMISARYARNWAAGAGLRYNLAPPEARPVEGYTNFLWVALLAAGAKFQIAPRTVTAVAGPAASMASVLLLGLWVRKRTGSGPAGIAAALGLAWCLPVAAWAVQGLETPLFALLALAAVATADPARPRGREHALAALACLCRPDGLLVAAAVIVAELGSFRRDPRRLLQNFAGFFLLPMAVYLAWKLAHFGAVVPNSFYAKTGLGMAGVTVGLRYALGFVVSASYFPVAGLFAVGLLNWALRGKTTAATDLVAPLVFIGLYPVFIVGVGGDFMPGHRFFVHLLPAMIGAGMIGAIGPAADGGSHATRRWARAVAIVIFSLAMLVALGVALVEPRWGSMAEFEEEWRRDQASWYGPTASWLARHAGRGDVIACGDIGYIGYVSGVDRVLDANGLVDPYLARRPGAAALDADPDYLLGQRPDFIVIMVHAFPQGLELGHAAMDRALLSRPELRDNYQLAAELPGWYSVERSLDDGLIHESQVGFKIFRRKISEGGKIEP